MTFDRYLKSYSDARIVEHLAASLARRCRAEGVEITEMRCRSSDDDAAWIFDGVSRWAVTPLKLEALRAMIAAALAQAKADVDVSSKEAERINGR